MRIHAKTAVHIVIGTVVLIAFGREVAPAQDAASSRCVALDSRVKQGLAARVRARYQSSPSAAVQIVDESVVAGGCYHRLIFEIQDGQRAYTLPLYLTPDQRYLTRDLTDVRGESQLAAASFPPTAPPAVSPVALSKGALASTGPPEAPATVVVFSDFQCFYCKRAAEWLRAVAGQFKPDQLRIIYRFYPLGMHDWAQPAAAAAACVASQSADAFWEFHDKIFNDQRSISAGNVKEKLAAYAESIHGLDPQAYRRCVDSGRSLEIIQGDQQLGNAVQVRGTPTVFVNGTMLSSLRSAGDLHAAIEQAVRGDRHARATTANGGTE